MRARPPQLSAGHETYAIKASYLGRQGIRLSRHPSLRWAGRP